MRKLCSDTLEDIELEEERPPAEPYKDYESPPVLPIDAALIDLHVPLANKKLGIDGYNLHIFKEDAYYIWWNRDP